MKRISLCIVLVTFCAASYGGAFNLFGGADSGKIAKLQFHLKDTFYPTSIAWSPDGRFIASASTHGKEIHIWDVQRRQTVQTLAGYGNAYQHSLSWSPDGRLLATCIHGHLRAYDAHTWSEAHVFDPQDRPVCSEMVAFSSDSREMALLGDPLVLSVYSAVDWHRIKEVRLWNGWGKGRPVHAIAYIPGTYTLLIAGADLRTVKEGVALVGYETGRVWSLPAEALVPDRGIQVYGESPGHQGGSGAAVSIAVSPDGRQFATGAMTGAGAPYATATESVHVFDLKTGRLLGAPLDRLPFGGQKALAYTPDSRYLIAAHWDVDTKAIHLIDARTLRVVDLVHGVDAIEDIATNPQSTQFAAAAGKEIIVWSLPLAHP